MLCTCIGGNDGFTQRSDGIWVHAKCRRPTAAYLESFMKKTDDELGLTHINLLRHGPLHNTILTNSQMIDQSSIDVRGDAKALHEFLHDYRWTTETVTGESGKVARVWVWKDYAG